MSQQLEPGQIRVHHKTGLAVEVIRRRPRARDWVIRYVDEPQSRTPRTMSGRILSEFYVVREELAA